jgi:hypothetical protein
LWPASAPGSAAAGTIRIPGFPVHPQRRQQTVKRKKGANPNRIASRLNEAPGGTGPTDLRQALPEGSAATLRTDRNRHPALQSTSCVASRRALVIDAAPADKVL